MHALLLGFGWFPEIKGITVVLIAVTVMIGGSYLILATNVGGRLGLLLVLSALFGWMTSMGIIWWSYGIGLKGTAASWKPKEIITPSTDQPNSLALSQFTFARGLDPKSVTVTNKVAGWTRLADDNPQRGQTVAEADAIVLKAGIYQTGDYQPVAAYTYGGDRYPNVSFHLGKFKFNMDYVAFLHKPHFAIVEEKALVKQATEPGKAPPTPVIDESAPPRYVLMSRDRGSLRRPAALITLGSGLLFGLFCYMLHARDRIVAANRSGALVPATGGD